MNKKDESYFDMTYDEFLKGVKKSEIAKPAVIYHSPGRPDNSFSNLHRFKSYMARESEKAEMTEDDIFIAKQIMKVFKDVSYFTDRAIFNLDRLILYTVGGTGKYKSLIAPYEEIRTGLQLSLDVLQRQIKYINSVINYTEKDISKND